MNKSKATILDLPKEKPTGEHVNLLQLSSARIKDENDQEVTVGHLWKTNTAILIFLRHFACIACRAHAAQVWKTRTQYEKNGAKIHFIGNGAASMIKVFKEELGILDAPMYTDRELVSFRAAGFKRGFLASMGPRSMANQVKLLTEGHRPGTPQMGVGDLWQLGGILVIKPTGRVAYHYISVAQGDFPPEEEILKLPWDSTR